jgi:hypothetical protein
LQSILSRIGVRRERFMKSRCPRAAVQASTFEGDRAVGFPPISCSPSHKKLRAGAPHGRRTLLSSPGGFLAGTLSGTVESTRAAAPGANKRHLASGPERPRSRRCLAFLLKWRLFVSEENQTGSRELSACPTPVPGPTPPPASRRRPQRLPAPRRLFPRRAARNKRGACGFARRLRLLTPLPTDTLRPVRCQLLLEAARYRCVVGSLRGTGVCHHPGRLW